MTPSATGKPPRRRASRRDAARLPLRWAGASCTKEGELYRRVVRDLRAQLVNTSAAEELLIARVAWLQVHLAHIDERAMKDGGLSPHATREYLAWAGAITRMLVKLGLKATAPRAPSLQEYLRAKAESAA